jgi:hypothetical protein
VVECNVLSDKVAAFERRFGEIESKSSANGSKLDSVSDSLSHLQGLIQVSEERQRGLLSEIEVQRTGQKTQIESLQESLTQLQARLQQQRLDETKQIEQLDAQSAGHGVRIESLQESVGNMQAWLQKQSMIEEKRAQIDAYNAAHRAETDELRNSVKTLETTLEGNAPLEARSAAVDAREVAVRAELDCMAQALDGHKAQQKSEFDVVTKSIQTLNGSLEEMRTSSDEVWSVMTKSIQNFNEMLDDVRSSGGANTKEIRSLNDIVEALKEQKEEVKAGSSVDMEEKLTRLETQFANSGLISDRMRSDICELQGSHQRYETKIQDFTTLLVSQEEGLKLEIGMLKQSKQEVQIRLDAVQMKLDLAQTEIQGVARDAADTAQMQRTADAADMQRATAALQLEAQQKETATMRNVIDTLQARMETVQRNAEATQIQLGEALKKDCEAAMNAKLQVITQESKAMEQLFQKLETAQALRNNIEAEVSGVQAGLKRFDAELQEDRRRRSEEVRRLETKDAEQQVIITELRSRVDIQDDTMRGQLNITTAAAATLNEVSSVEVVEQRAQLASLKAQLQAGTESLQLQQQDMKNVLQDHMEQTRNTSVSLESRLRATEVQTNTLEATTMVRAQNSGESHDAIWEDLMVTKLGEARQEWQGALEEERNRTADRVKMLGRSVNEECRTQAATQARLVVQSMLSQELDSWRRELNDVHEKIATTPTPVLPSKLPRAGSEADDDERNEPPGLAEAVRRLDDRLAMQRREAAALDELLRSELEVQRRQQSLTSTTLQSIQDRLTSVEERTEAMRTQIEDTLREDASLPELEGRSTPGGARFQSALTDIADAVRNPLQRESSSTGDDIHRRIKALSQKMAQCQGSNDGASLSFPPGAVNSMGSAIVPAGGLSHATSGSGIDTLATSRRSRMDEQPVYDALNMPQALQDMIPQAGHAQFAIRQPSVERSVLHTSHVGPGSPNANQSRGLYAFRQLSPSAQVRQPTPSYSTHRPMSPGASLAVPVGRPHRGSQSPRRQQTPGRGLVPDMRLQSAPPPVGASPVMAGAYPGPNRRQSSQAPGTPLIGTTGPAVPPSPVQVPAMPVALSARPA